MRIVLLLLAAAAGGLLVGCGKQPAPEPDRPAGGAESERAAPSESGAAARKTDDTVFAPLLNDVERARGVQKTVDEQAERLKKEIEKAEGSSDGR